MKFWILIYEDIYSCEEHSEFDTIAICTSFENADTLRKKLIAEWGQEEEYFKIKEVTADTLIF